MSRRLLVLGWHNIDPTPFYPAAPGTGRRGFARQLALVEKLGTVVPLDEAVTALAEGRSLPPRAIALTFDDGYADWLDAAVPELDRRGMHGTFFLVSDILSGRIGAWWEELADAFDRATAPTLEWDGRTLPLATPEDRRSAQAAVAADLKLVDRETRVAGVHRVAAAIAPPAPDRAPLFLDWDGARALAATGHGIGSHTVTHPILSRETPSAQTRELVDSRQALEEGLARTVDLLAYPNGNAGDYDDTTLTRTAAAGYRAAVTTRPGLASSSVSPFEMRRVVLTPHDDLRALVGKVARKGSGVATKVAGKVAGKVGRRPSPGSRATAAAPHGHADGCTELRTVEGAHAGVSPSGGGGTFGEATGRGSAASSLVSEGAPAVTIVPLRADGSLVSIDIWHRVTTAMRARYRGGALAQYGAGLHTDCDDCATPPADVVVPAPRQRSTDPAPASAPQAS